MSQIHDHGTGQRMKKFKKKTKSVQDINGVCECPTEKGRKIQTNHQSAKPKISKQRIVDCISSEMVNSCMGVDKQEVMTKLSKSRRKKLKKKRRFLDKLKRIREANAKRCASCDTHSENEDEHICTGNGIPINQNESNTKSCADKLCSSDQTLNGISAKNRTKHKSQPENMFENGSQNSSGEKDGSRIPKSLSQPMESNEMVKSESAISVCGLPLPVALPSATLPGLEEYVALDCEFVGVGPRRLSALGRCSVVDYNGFVLLDVYVRPDERITDYRTPWSGIRPRDLKKAIPFHNARNMIRKIIKRKIVVGHALWNDFSVMKIAAGKLRVRDTSTYPPLRQMAKCDNGSKMVSLKKLALTLCGMRIQKGEHCSVEDASATMSIFKLVRTQWETGLLNKNMPSGTIIENHQACQPIRERHQASQPITEHPASQSITCKDQASQPITCKDQASQPITGKQHDSQPIAVKLQTSCPIKKNHHFFQPITLKNRMRQDSQRSSISETEEDSFLHDSFWPSMRIQKGEHCSVEDASATMSIFKLVRTQWETGLLNKNISTETIIENHQACQPFREKHQASQPITEHPASQTIKCKDQASQPITCKDHASQPITGKQHDSQPIAVKLQTSRPIKKNHHFFQPITLKNRIRQDSHRSSISETEEDSFLHDSFWPSNDESQ